MARKFYVFNKYFASKKYVNSLMINVSSNENGEEDWIQTIVKLHENVIIILLKERLVNYFINLFK
ncbi:MAG: hypothetical protein KTM48_04055, partial [Wolbachia endosymbiont of Pissodes strobi]|nr:hypothetical protein [Wolbachia endosymbiont of Pissodes strobi]